MSCVYRIELRGTATLLESAPPPDRLMAPMPPRQLTPGRTGPRFTRDGCGSEAEMPPLCGISASVIGAFLGRKAPASS